jgi:hypothetical protein
MHRVCGARASALWPAGIEPMLATVKKEHGRRAAVYALRSIRNTCCCEDLGGRGLTTPYC